MADWVYRQDPKPWPNNNLRIRFEERGPASRELRRSLQSAPAARLESGMPGWIASTVRQLGITLMARDTTTTIVKREIVLSIIINIFARCVSGAASVGLNAVAVLYPR